MPQSEQESAGELPRPLRDHLATDLVATLSTATESVGEEHRPEAVAVLRDARRERATDIHLDPQSSGLLIRFRIDGVVHDVALLPHPEAVRLVNQLKTMARLNPMAAFAPEEGRVTCYVDEEELDLRITVAPCLAGDKMAIRLLEPYRVRHRLEELGLHDRDLEHIQEWVDNINGMFLVAGPTGSGKTTTLYALLHVLKVHERNIVTIEDPVEYQIEGVNQIQVDRTHGLDFASGVKSMLRLDPDYMLLGEIRDEASARAAINAAASGRVLMSTLHSRDAVGVVTVLRNFGLRDHEIASELTMVVTQRLVRTLCPHCKEARAPAERDVSWLACLGFDAPERVWYPVGCDRCSGIGYLGRTGVFELWRIADEDYDLILRHADEHAIHTSLARRGHVFLLSDGLVKLAGGLTSVQELRAMGSFGGPRHLTDQIAST